MAIPSWTISWMLDSRGSSWPMQVLPPLPPTPTCMRTIWSRSICSLRQFFLWLTYPSWKLGPLLVGKLFMPCEFFASFLGVRVLFGMFCWCRGWWLFNQCTYIHLQHMWLILTAALRVWWRRADTYDPPSSVWFMLSNVMVAPWSFITCPATLPTIQTAWQSEITWVSVACWRIFDGLTAYQSCNAQLSSIA